MYVCPTKCKAVCPAIESEKAAPVITGRLSPEDPDLDYSLPDAGGRGAGIGLRGNF